MDEAVRGLPLEERLGDRVLFMPDGCWQWTGRTCRGYGYLCVDGKERCAHRVAYELLAGPIPEGLDLDHLCRNKSCVNPTHLEPVTHQENVARSTEGFAALNARKTHCPKGHPYDEANTVVYQGRRNCRVCLTTNNRKRKADRRRFAETLTAEDRAVLA